MEFYRETYTIKQSAFLWDKKYTLYGGSEKLLTAEKKSWFSLENKIKFKDKMGKKVIQIENGEGAYVIKSKGHEIANLILKPSINFQWNIEAPNSNSVYAKICRQSSGRAWLRLLGVRQMPDFMSWIPRKYKIENEEGDKIGEVNGNVGIRYSYDVDFKNVPKNLRKPVILSILVILAEGP